MKLSQFESDVMNAIIKGNSEEDILRIQLASAEVAKRDYTGVGLYVDFNITETVPTLSNEDRHIDAFPNLALQHPDLEACAGAILWISNGKISTLELYTFDGDWPEDETLFKII